MADTSALERALVNADAAGDVAAAQALAGEINRLRVDAPPDKYQQAAIDEKATGGGDTTVNAAGRFLRNAVVPAPLRMMAGAVDDLTGGKLGAIARTGQQGATLGAGDEIMAALETPAEMYRRGTLDPREAFNYAKAREDLSLSDARNKAGIAGTVAEIAGGGATGALAAPFGAARFLSSAPSLLGRTAALGADGAAFGGITGFNEGNGFAERFGNAGQGALIGGLVGGALPTVGVVAKGAVSPFISNIMARVNPQGTAEKQAARAIIESGRSTDDIARDVMTAANEGQGVYTVADALGNSGQRMLSTVARAPGEGRTAVVNALDGRQGTQGRRVSNALAEGFEAPETALRTEARLTGARDDAADIAYGAARNDAGAVDVTGTIARIDRTLGPAADQMLSNSGSTAANDSVVWKPGEARSWCDDAARYRNGKRQRGAFGGQPWLCAGVPRYRGGADGTPGGNARADGRHYPGL